MKNPENSYILNYDKKEIVLTWRGEKFVFNLNDGDIGDYWNSLTHSSGLQKDVNFHQEEGEEPNFEIWNLIEDEDGQLQIDTDEEYIECAYTEGTQSNYFNPPDGWEDLRNLYYANNAEIDRLHKLGYEYNKMALELLEEHKEDKVYCKDMIDFVFATKVEEVIEFHVRKKYLGND